MEACPSCGAKRFVRDEARGEEVCVQCGLARDLPPVSLPVRDAAPALHGRGRLPPRLQRLQSQRGEPGNVHRLRLAQDEARRLAGALGCPADVGERAAKLLERARKQGLTQGRALDAMAPAALLASCRILLLARTEDEVAKAAKVPWSSVNPAYKALVRGLRLKVPALTAKAYLGQVAAKVGLDGKVQADAYRLLQPVCGTARSAGKSPLGWGAAALLLAARSRGLSPSVHDLSAAAMVSPTTLMARASELVDANGGLGQDPAPAEPPASQRRRASPSPRRPTA